MTDVPWDYDAFLDDLVAWAERREDVLAAVVLGSRARDADRPADEWSDLDCLLVTTDPDGYLADADWLADLGDAWLTFRESTATGDLTERRALFAPGLDVDFVPVSADSLEAVAAAGSDVLARGYRVVYDETDVRTALADAV
ncbi:aminoglycoside 6-adenylyltransferase, partial [Halorussus sp. GCM10023401]